MTSNNKIALVILSSSIISSCKTTSPKKDNSDLRGSAAYSVVSSYMKANTPEEMIAAITKRLNDLNRYTSAGEPANIGNCPISASDPCSLVNIFIEFETPGSGSVGHTAISISHPEKGEDLKKRSDQFFDFGPGRDTLEDGTKIKVGDPGIFSLPPGTFSGLFSGVPGTQWWDNQHRFPGDPTPSQIGVKEIIESIDKLADDYTVIRVPLCVTKAHAAIIFRYWVKAYTNMPPYRIPGNHCTSMVAQSFESTINASKELNRSTYNWAIETLDAYVPNPREIKRWITSPTGYAERVLSGNYSGTLDYRHQCGELKGKLPNAIVVRNESLFEEEKMRQFVGWKADRSIP